MELSNTSWFFEYMIYGLALTRNRHQRNKMHVTMITNNSGNKELLVIAGADISGPITNGFDMGFSSAISNLAELAAYNNRRIIH